MSRLVDYDYSDSESENEEQGNEKQVNDKDENEKQKNKNHENEKYENKKHENHGDEEQKLLNENQITSSFLKNLPKIQHSQMKASTTSLLSKDLIKRTANGRIQIKAPVLNISEDSNDSDKEDNEEREKKRLKASDKGCGLFSILPEAKRKILKINTNTSIKHTIPFGLIPKSVSDLKTVSKPQVLKSINTGLPNDKNNDDEDDDDDDDETESFLFLKHKPITSNSTPSVSQLHDNFSDNDNQLEYGPAKPRLVEEASNSPNSHEDFAYKRMIASKFGEEAPENINIVDFNMEQHLRDNKEWIKNISKESEVIEDGQIGGSAPNAAAKRRNQITYLAYQAKKREVELKNQWAANRQTMQQSRSRYGF